MFSQQNWLLPSLLLVLICAVLQCLPADAQNNLQYQRGAVSNGEIWRALSGHFVHLGWRHLLLNVAALLLICALFSPEWHLSSFLSVALTGAPLISLALWFFEPEVVWYVGLSGLLHCFFAYYSLTLLAKQPHLAALFIAGLLIKLLLESGQADDQVNLWLGGRVIDSAHRWGACVGGLLFLASRAVAATRGYRPSS